MHSSISKKQKKTVTSSIQDSIAINLDQEILSIQTLPDFILLTINNPTLDTLSFGSNYKLEYYQAGQWHILNNKEGFELVEFRILPKSQWKQKIHLYPHERSYKEGAYRINKELKLGKKEIFLSKEFRIEK